MKKIILLFLSTIYLLSACGGDPISDEPETPTPQPDPNPEVTTYSVNGNVQKGPFTQGTSITIQALDESLNPTGKNYQTKTADDAGSFKINNQIESRYVEIIATGYYFNENSGRVSNSTITLRSLSDLTESGKTNVNLLTTLEADRVRSLVISGGMSLKEAREQAERELFDIFHIPNAVSSSVGFDKMDITKRGEANAILLAISATLQGNRSEGELSELISKIASEIEISGEIQNDIIIEQIREGGMSVNAETVRNNLEKRYDALGITDYEIPPFEDYLDVNGNGAIDKQDNWLIISEKDFMLSDEGGTIEIELKHNIDYDVTIEDDGNKWIEDKTTRAYLETDKLIFYVSKNETYDPRYARIAVKDRNSSYTEYITISQKQLDALTVTSERFEVDKNGGTIDVEVKANVNFDIEIPQEYSNWIAYMPGTRGLTATNLQFKISKNNEPEVREGKVIIKSGELSETITIYQTGEKVLILNQKEYAVSDQGVTINVEVTSNIDYEIVMPPVNWISETQKTRGIITNTRSFVIAPNPTYDAREAEIIFRDKNSSLQETVTIYQMQKDAIIVAKKSYNFDNKGGELALSLQANVDVDVEIPEASQEWITQALPTRALTERILNFVVAANDEYDKREGEIIVKNSQKNLSDTIKIYQTQKDAIILTQNEYSIPNEGGNFAVEVRSNIDFSVYVDSGDSWLRQVTTRGLTSHTLNFIADANTTYDTRKAVITITNTANNLKESIKVSQSQKNAIIVGSNEFEVPYSGGDVNIEIKSNIDYEVIIEDDIDWITKVPNTRGLTESTVCLKVSKNEDIEARVGKVTIQDTTSGISNTVTITQTGNAEVQTINVAEAGTLGSILSDSQKNNIVNVKITGSINKDDFRTLENMPSLTNLDLSESKIEANIIPEEAMSQPNGFGSISSWKSDSNIETILLPEGIISIGEHAFHGCKLLRHINIPETVKQIKDGAFMNTAVESIDIPAEVLSISREAFANCSALQSVDFASNAKLQRIESSASGDPLGNSSSYGAFKNCTSLRYVKLPSSISHIGVGTFNGCTSLEELIFPDDIALTAIEGYYYKDSHVIGSKPVTGGLIEGCIALKELRIPAKIERIDKYAFAESGIERVIFADGSRCSIIGDQVFAACSNLTSIELPSTIKELGDQVFLNCILLEALDLSTVEKIGSAIFSGCSALKSISLPQNMTEIGDNFFAGCSALEKCNISNNLVRIGDGAFSGCVKLLNIPESTALEEIGQQAFKGCTSLKSVKIPQSVTAIQDAAFEDCTSLSDFVLQHNDSIALHRNIWNNCSSLTNLQLSARRIYLGGAIFRGTKLSNIELPEEVEFWGVPTSPVYDNNGHYRWDYDYNTFSTEPPFEDSMISSITFASGSRLKECGALAFAGAEYVSSITLPTSVETIGAAMFEGNTSLLEFNIPSHIKRITGPVYSYSHVIHPIVENPANIEYLGTCALGNIKNSTLDLSNCSYIGDAALSYCTELSSVTLCQSGSLILGEQVFFGSTKLTEIIFPQGLTEVIGHFYDDLRLARPFAYSYIKKIYCEPDCKIARFSYISFDAPDWSSTSQLESVDLSNITSSEVEMLEMGHNNAVNSTLSEFKLPRCKILTLTRGYLLYNMPQLKKIEIPGTIQKVVEQDFGKLFGDNLSINEIIGEENGSELEIPGSFFADLTTLETVYLPGLKIIGNEAFRGCTNLKNLVLGSGDVVMGASIFKDAGLTELIISDNATSLTFYDPFNRISALAGSSIQTIKTSTYAKLRSLICKNGENPKNGTLTLKNVDLPSVTSIGDHFFNGYTNISHIQIPNVMTIGELAFANCTTITNIDLPNVTTIGNSGFNNCTNLSSISSPNLETIGDAAFANCTALTNIDLPNVTTIGDSGFYGCSNLSSTSFSKLETIGDYAFYNTSLISIDLPSTMKNMGLACFPNSITTVICRAIQPPTWNINTNPFVEMDLPNSILKVPSESLDHYKAPNITTWQENYWSGFGSILPIE